jgi:hypothetical protein
VSDDERRREKGSAEGVEHEERKWACGVEAARSESNRRREKVLKKNEKAPNQLVANAPSWW